MKLSINLIVFSLLIACSASQPDSQPSRVEPPGGGHGTGNGGGLAEANIHHAYRTLDIVVRSAARSFVFDASDKDALAMLESSAALERSRPRDLLIEKDPLRPAFDMPAEPGAAVFINIDALYPLDAAGTVQPYDLARSYAFWIEALGSRLNASSPAVWKKIGEKVMAFIRQSSEVLIVPGFDSNGPGIRVFWDSSSQSVLSVTIIGVDPIVDVTETVVGKKGERFSYRGLYWKRVEPTAQGWALEASGWVALVDASGFASDPVHHNLVFDLIRQADESYSVRLRP